MLSTAPRTHSSCFCLLHPSKPLLGSPPLPRPPCAAPDGPAGLPCLQDIPAQAAAARGTAPHRYNPGKGGCQPPDSKVGTLLPAAAMTGVGRSGTHACYRPSTSCPLCLRPEVHTWSPGVTPDAEGSSGSGGLRSRSSCGATRSTMQTPRPGRLPSTRFSPHLTPASDVDVWSCPCTIRSEGDKMSWLPVAGASQTEGRPPSVLSLFSWQPSEGACSVSGLC